MKSIVAVTNGSPLVLLSFSDLLKGVKESDVVREELARVAEEIRERPGDLHGVSIHTLLGTYLVTLEAEGR